METERSRGGVSTGSISDDLTKLYKGCQKPLEKADLQDKLTKSFQLMQKMLAVMERLEAWNKDLEEKILTCLSCHGHQSHKTKRLRTRGHFEPLDLSLDSITEGQSLDDTMGEISSSPGTALAHIIDVNDSDVVKSRDRKYVSHIDSEVGSEMPTMEEENGNSDTEILNREEENGDLDSEMPTTEENGDLESEMPTREEENGDSESEIPTREEENGDSDSEIVNREKENRGSVSEILKRETDRDQVKKNKSDPFFSCKREVTSSLQTSDVRSTSVRKKETRRTHTRNKFLRLQLPKLNNLERKYTVSDDTSGQKATSDLSRKNENMADDLDQKNKEEMKQSARMSRRSNTRKTKTSNKRKITDRKTLGNNKGNLNHHKIDTIKKAKQKKTVVDDLDEESIYPIDRHDRYLSVDCFDIKHIFKGFNKIKKGVQSYNSETSSPTLAELECFVKSSSSKPVMTACSPLSSGGGCDEQDELWTTCLMVSPSQDAPESVVNCLDVSESTTNSQDAPLS